MGDDKDIPVLRRKAAARRASLGLAEMTPQKAMRLALAKAGDKALSVPVSLREMAECSLTPDDLDGALPDPSLILRLEGPGDAVALAVLCPQAVAAATEAQTMGRVLQTPAAGRRPTATDASLVADFVQQVLAAFAALAADCKGLPAMDGYEYAGRVIDTRVAAMAIQDAAHLHMTVQMAFAGGAKEGALHLVLPRRATAGAARTTAGPDWSSAIEKAVMGSSVRLEAVLCRVRLPLSQVTGFAPGQVVPLEKVTLDGVELRSVDGRRILSARLGRSGVMRAVRLQIGEDGHAGQGAQMAPSHTPLPSASAPPEPAPAPMDLPDPAPLDDLPGDLEPMAATLSLPD